MACRPSPPQGGDQTSLPISPIANVEREAAALKLPISPLAGEMPGRAEGGASRGRLQFPTKAPR
ncbi:MAG: hypothetical protein E5W96_34280 [Mesorhizobium sp.]|nr:MAG: hypothetical protein E5W96_34280 [Mesorhizobium sp.]